MLTDTARFPQRGGLTLNRQRWRARDHHCPTTHLKAKRPGWSAACGCQAGLRGSRAGSHPSRGWQPRAGCWLPPWLLVSAQRGAWQPLGFRAPKEWLPRTNCAAATLRQPSTIQTGVGAGASGIPGDAQSGTARSVQGQDAGTLQGAPHFFCEKSVPRRAPAPKPLIDPNWCAPFLR